MRLTDKLLLSVMIASAAAGWPFTLARAEAGPPVVKITASRFHFTPDHIVVAKGRPVTLQLTSTDATHGFMLRVLNIDTDILPGKITAITVTPPKAGTFKVICDHYCGSGHGSMKMTIDVVDQPSNAALIEPPSGVPISG